MIRGAAVSSAVARNITALLRLLLIFCDPSSPSIFGAFDSSASGSGNSGDPSLQKRWLKRRAINPSNPSMAAARTKSKVAIKRIVSAGRPFTTLAPYCHV